MVDHRGWDNVEPTAPVAGACALSWLLFRRFWLSGPFACPIGPGRTRSRPLKGWPPVRQTCAPFARRARPSRGPSPPCPSLGSNPVPRMNRRAGRRLRRNRRKPELFCRRSDRAIGADSTVGPVPTANTRLHRPLLGYWRCCRYAAIFPGLAFILGGRATKAAAMLRQDSTAKHSSARR